MHSSTPHTHTPVTMEWAVGPWQMGRGRFSDSDEEERKESAGEEEEAEARARAEGAKKEMPLDVLACLLDSANAQTQVIDRNPYSRFARID